MQPQRQSPQLPQTDDDLAEGHRYWLCKKKEVTINSIGAQKGNVKYQKGALALVYDGFCQSLYQKGKMEQQGRALALVNDSFRQGLPHKGKRKLKVNSHY
jgi:hypothetical protein